MERELCHENVKHNQGICNQPIDSWNVSSDKDMSSMVSERFCCCLVDMILLQASTVVPVVSVVHAAHTTIAHHLLHHAPYVHLDAAV